MIRRLATSIQFLTIAIVVGFACAGGARAQTTRAAPEKVYVPYDKLKEIFESEKQGVFLPYADFQRLWAAARGAPADAVKSPLGYLISTARFSGKISGKLAEMNLLLTVDIMNDRWTEVPVALGQVAVARADFKTAPDAKAKPLLRVVNGKYSLLVKGKGRWVVSIDFVRQLVTKPGQNVLEYQIPSAAISTLELLIPEENMKVDVEPMLAAATSQVTTPDKIKSTRLKAFLGSSDKVKLSWRPKTQAAAGLAPVVICSQLQHINVVEALITYDVKFNYDIRRRGVDSFTIQLPPEFRVTAVDGANISKWDILVPDKVPAKDAVQALVVKLYSEAKGAYSLSVKMERFLKEATLSQALTPIVTHRVLRRTGLIAITHSPRRSVEVTDVNKELVRVDVGRLPRDLRTRPGVTAYRFTSAGYGANMQITAVAPRTSAAQFWSLGVRKDNLSIYGRLNYSVERAGIFSVSMKLPESWEITSLGPANIVHDYELAGKGDDRAINITLKRELSGSFALDLFARAARDAPDGDVKFTLPLPDAKNLHNYTGRLVLHLADSLTAEVAALDQLQSMPVRSAGPVTGSQRNVAMRGLTPAMAFEFRAVDRAKGAGAAFKTSVKPAQVSAVVHRLVDIQDGSVQHEAVIAYNVRYAPLDTFYVKMPAALAEAGVDISGANIKEKPLLPPDRHPEMGGGQNDEAKDARDIKWACYKVVLQSPVSGAYNLTVKWRKSYQVGGDKGPATIDVPQVLAAGELSDQSGYIAVRKAATLSVGTGEMKDLVFGDPSSKSDLPWAPHRRDAIVALRHSLAKYELTLPVRMQKEAEVYTTIANAVIVEQTLARDGTLNGRMICLLSTSRGDRLKVTMPTGAKVYPFMLNGREAAVESPSPDVRVVQLPHSAGQVARSVLEITYGLDADSGAVSMKLPAPSLPDEVPVQRTFWRVYVPDDHVVLGYDRNFAIGGDYQIDSLFDRVATGHERQLGKFPAQGRLWRFARQGAVGEFSMTLMKREIFIALLWAAIILPGAVLLKVRGFTRAIAVLAAVTVAAVMYQFNPLLVKNAARFGGFAGIMVLLLWFAHWVFFRVLRSRKSYLPPPPPVSQAPTSDQGDTAIVTEVVELGENPDDRGGEEGGENEND